MKVDREERPDIDALYMTVCQMLTGRGGWPLTILMTPDKRPFFAGTYLPKHGRHGQPGLAELVPHVERLWRHERAKLLEAADSIHAHLEAAILGPVRDATPPDIHDRIDAGELADRAFAALTGEFDPEYGGFQPAPKFPMPHRLLFLLRHDRKNATGQGMDMTRRTLDAMIRGGVWDQVGFGLHRYSTDGRWRLPHFEKMLYDQSLLALASLEAYRITGETPFAALADNIFTYVCRDLRDAGGAFHSAEDADSEGEEGRFYVWSLAEFRQAAGPEEADAWAAFWSLTSKGNFHDEATGQLTGANILYRESSWTELADRLGVSPEEAGRRWDAFRQRLLDIRSRRERPLKDDKVLADWNGLMIAALAAGARIMDRPDLARDAEAAARFVLERMAAPEGRLFHRWRDGEAAITATADDYAFLAWGCLELFFATFAPEWLERAVTLMDVLVADFRDPERGDFFLAPADTDLPARPREIHDGAMPSANAVALHQMNRLFRITGDLRWRDWSDGLIRSFCGHLDRHPLAAIHFLSGMMDAANPDPLVVVRGNRDDPDTRALLAAASLEAEPVLVTPETAADLARLAPSLAGSPVPENGATAQVCWKSSCRRPVHTVEELRGLLAR